MSKLLLSILQNNRQDTEKHLPKALYSVCSTHELVLRAALRQARLDGMPLLVEATCNQVNQFGGYTGMTPRDFRAYLLGLAKEEAFESHQLILGGDHLGPNVWQKETASEAMEKAKELVRTYVEAGFEKIHLDCSMSCQDDSVPLAPQIIAQRAAELCSVAEDAAKKNGMMVSYVIGTEVPTPGGAKEEIEGLVPTTATAAKETIEMHRVLFEKEGLLDAWERVIALVVQPGVEFDHWSVEDFIPQRIKDLPQAIKDLKQFVYEAHSTDYQKPQAYKDLVKEHFAILKVGPALTYALREALMLLEQIAHDTGDLSKEEGFRGALLKAMEADPSYWQAYYHGTRQEQQFACLYSLSDRCRYYLGQKDVVAAIEKLLVVFSSKPVPLVLISQYFPNLYDEVRQNNLSPSAEDLIILHIQDRVLRSYAQACR